MVDGLVRHVGIREISLAEDIVQDTFIAAQEQWKNHQPGQPEAWLFKVSRNIGLKRIRDQKEFTYPIDERRFEDAFEIESNELDSAIRILLSCAHPRFSPKQQVILALRYAVGFKVNQIATVLASSPETITKIIQRIKSIFKEENIKLQSNWEKPSVQSMDIVLKTLYLMFNEGYKTSMGKSILNETLCEDAVSITQNIVKGKLADESAYPLYALMLFNLSRFETRFDPAGELVDLERQDRSLWNKEMIQVATHYMMRSQTSQPTTYHLEATIAYLHCTAPSFDKTDWKKIITLYTQLHRINESPFVNLNLAIAHFYSGNIVKAIAIMEEIGKIAFINNYYLFHVAQGKIFTATNQFLLANAHYTKALTMMHHDAEKNYIRKLMSL